MYNLYFNFNPGNYNLSNQQVDDIDSLVTVKDSSIVSEYEDKYFKNVGVGYGFSSAAGRMAFYLLLRVLDIQRGDEVIVVGFTCSVMINAILRVGATPVYTDVSPITFGSNSTEIRKAITNNTKLIVAQHSFGIPCEIEEIINIGKEKEIFVLEDCALALGSKVKGKSVGTFGDAALFSTDHTKPINTLIGGFFYTGDRKLYNSILHEFSNAKELNVDQQNNLFKQFLLERKWYHPKYYKYYKYYYFTKRVKNKIFGKSQTALFMDGDNGPPDKIKPKYPYPAKLPTFLAKIGLFELEHFEKEKERRKQILKRYLDIFSKSIFAADISKVYYNNDLSIVPLRFVFYSDKANLLIKKASQLIDFSQIWFKRPIIATSFELDSFGYELGTCPNSEKIGKKIINFPCVIPEDVEENYFKLLEKIIINIE